MHAPLISIIVPIHKVEPYLEQCVNSIINQTYKNLEIILVDDGSPDNCPAICDSYATKDPRIRIIHKQNGGLSSARNAGLSIATGEYIGYVDSDDFIEPAMYSTLLEILEKDLGAGAVACRFNLVENGKIKNHTSTAQIKEGTRISGDDLIKEGLFCCYTIAVWNKLYRREVIEGIKFVEGRNGEDTIYHYQMCKSLKKKNLALVYTNACLLNYRKDNPNSICNNITDPFDMDVLENFKLMIPMAESEEEREMCIKAYHQRIILFLTRLVIHSQLKKSGAYGKYFNRVYRLTKNISYKEIIGIRGNLTWKGHISMFMLKYTPCLFKIIAPAAYRVHNYLKNYHKASLIK